MDTTEKPFVTTVKPGVELLLKSPLGLFYKERVSLPCQGSFSGKWYCVTHSLRFADNCEKDQHCKIPGTHELAWLCNQHGVETP